MFRKIFLPVLYKAFQCCSCNAKNIPDSASLLVDLLPLFSTPLFTDHHNTFLGILCNLFFLGGCYTVFLSIQKAHSMRTSVFLNRLHLLCLFSLWATLVAHSVTFQLSLMPCFNWIEFKIPWKNHHLFFCGQGTKSELFYSVSPTGLLSLDCFSLRNCSILQYSGTNC